MAGCLRPASRRESNRDPARDVEECYRLGVNTYVVKPTRFSEFVEAVKQIGVFWVLLNEPSPSGVKIQ